MCDALLYVQKKTPTKAPVTSSPTANPVATPTTSLVSFHGINPIFVCLNNLLLALVSRHSQTYHTKFASFCSLMPQPTNNPNPTDFADVEDLKKHKKPTSSPTPAPTAPPTPAPTAPPTPAPTAPPTTQAPTSCEDRTWWIDLSDAEKPCYNENGAPANAILYGKWSECCEVQGNILASRGLCRYDDVCTTPSPSISPAPTVFTEAPTGCESRSFYVDSKKQCSNSGPPPPGEETWETAKKCCDANGTEKVGVVNSVMNSVMNSVGAMEVVCSFVDICVTKRPTISPTQKPVS